MILRNSAAGRRNVWSLRQEPTNIARVGTLVVIGAIFFFLFYVGSSGSRRVKRLMALETRGVRGRGLVLSSSFLSTGSTVNGQRYETRTMTLDVEVPGREPYVCTGAFLIPRGLVEPVPGASLDLAVDRGNKNLIAVVGPGGFSGPWLRVGPPAPY